MLKKILPKGEFAKNVLTLLTGTLFAQALPVLISPILTRLYSPEDFGLFALYSSLVMGLLTLASLRYDLTIVLPKKDRDAKKIVLLCQYIAIVFCVGIGIIFVLLHEQIQKWLGNAALGPWLYFVAANVLILALVNIYQYYLNRHKQYKIMSHSKMLQSGVMSFSQVGFGLLPLTAGVTGIVCGSLLGQVANLIYLFRQTRTRLRRVRISASNSKKIMLTYKKMPLLNGPNAVVDAIRLNGINIVIANLFSSVLLGQFALAWRVLQAPLSLINGALSQVCYQQMASMPASGLFEFIKRSIFRSFCMGLIPFAILYFFAPLLFAFIFGAQWQDAGIVARLLVPWLFLNLITSPISTFFIVVQRQGILFVFACFYMAVPLLILWLNKNDFIQAMTLMSYSMSCLLLVFVLLALTISYSLRIAK